MTNSDSEHYTKIQEGVIASLRVRSESLIVPREEESLCFQVRVQTLLYFLQESVGLLKATQHVGLLCGHQRMSVLQLLKHLT